MRRLGKGPTQWTRGSAPGGPPEGGAEGSRLTVSNQGAYRAHPLFSVRQIRGLDAYIVPDRPVMPPSSTADNGGFAWFVTLRPRAETYTKPLRDRFVRHILESLKPDWHWIVEEKSNHVHAAFFLHDGQQRSNLVTGFLGKATAKRSDAPLFLLDEQEKANFRRFTKDGKAAVKNLTTVQCITEYLSGEYARKVDDDFLVLSENLPDDEDISELEEYLPCVDGLKRKRQRSPWYHQAEAAYFEFRKAHPAEYPFPTDERHVLRFVNKSMYATRTMDVIADQKILKARVVALVKFINMYEGDEYNDITLLDCESQLKGRKKHKAIMDSQRFNVFADMDVEKSLQRQRGVYTDGTLVGQPEVDPGSPSQSDP